MASWFIIQNLLTGLVLNVWNGYTDIGTPIIAYEYVPSPDFNANELWIFNGTYIYSQQSGLVLDINLPGIEGSELIVSEPSTSPTQKWTVETSTGYIRNANGLVITVFNNSPDEGALVVVDKPSDQDGQKFQISYLSEPNEDDEVSRNGGPRRLANTLNL